MNLALLAWLACAGAAGAAGAAGGRWRWPDEAESVRVDTKVRFLEPDEPRDRSTEHFLPAASRRHEGRYPVHVHDHRDYRHEYSDGTLDSLEYCKCVSEPGCLARTDLPNACGVGKYLCCYKRPNKQHQTFNSIYNDVGEDRLFNEDRPILVGPEGPTGYIGPANPKQDVLVGPSGPTGFFGSQNPGVLVGPGGPTGVVGPQQDRGVLVGPEGPTGVIGPNQKDVLVGPGGPTGVIGPVRVVTEAHAEPSAQRGVLVGPGGPTGIIGPGYGGGRRGVLVGPGGPTGVVGPGFGRGRGVLVGPGGPTGVIGPGGYGFSRNRPGMFFGSGYGR